MCDFPLMVIRKNREQSSTWQVGAGERLIVSRFFAKESFHLKA